MRSETFLILGGSGMLGHVLWEYARDRSNAFVGLRSIPPFHEDLYSTQRTILGIDAANVSTIEQCLKTVKPTCIINCIGITKQSKEMLDLETTIRVNSLFPHVLARLCSEHQIRLIHLSTDCVYSGKKGQYVEEDEADPVDFYGRSKLLGEPMGDHVLVIRKSMIGFELQYKRGLLEWLISQSGKTVRGFRRAIFSGFYTRNLASIIFQLAKSPQMPIGLRHLASEPISKYDLISRICRACDLPVTIVPDDSEFVDRSLCGKKILREIEISIPTWDDMVKQIAKDYWARKG